MIVRSLTDIEKTENFVEWGNGTSHRLLTAKDNMGFTVCHTIVRAGTESTLEYDKHLEACYCIGGSGEIEDLQTGEKHPVSVGTIYALDKHDKHCMRAGDKEDMILVSVFNPALTGTETHNLDGSEGSGY